jgi:PAS domain S-box-containing protein
VERERVERERVERERVERERVERERVERERDERFRALVLATGQLVWTARPDGAVSQENVAWQAFTGQSSSQIEQQGWREAIHPADLAHVTQLWQRAAADRATYETECRLRRHDGVYRTFLLRGVPVLGADGQIREWVGCCTDITERKQAEAEAAARARESEAVIESLAQPIAVFDAAGHITRINAAMRAHVAAGHLPPSAPDDPATRIERFDMRDEQGQRFSPKRAPLQRVLRGETIADPRGVEMRLRTYGGREARVHFTGAPLRDEHDQVIGAVCAYQDVTLRRAAEERTNATLQALLDMAQSLVLPEEPSAEEVAQAEAAGAPATLAHFIAQRLLDLTTSVLECKRVSISVIDPRTGLSEPLAVSGLPSAEQERQWWEEQRHQPQVSLSESPDQALVARMRAGEVILFDMRQPPYNELPNPFNVNVVLIAPMRVGEQLVGVLALDFGGEEHEYIEDELALAGTVGKLAALVIERERLLRDREEALANALAARRAKERVDEFVSMANHELRSPLTAVRLNLQRLLRQQRKLIEEDSPRADERQRDTLERSIMQTDRLLRLVEDMLDAARAQSGRLQIRLVPTDLAEIVKEMVAEECESSPQRSITIEGDTDRPMPILADPDRIGQVLTNFLTNALKYTPQESPIQILLRREDGRARVAVRDQGPGLTPEQMRHVWDLYYQAEGIENQAGTGKGLGLGLYITRTIVEHHQGCTGVESTPGVGSTFWFELPIAATATDEETIPCA